MVRLRTAASEEAPAVGPLGRVVVAVGTGSSSLAAMSPTWPATSRATRPTRHLRTLCAAGMLAVVALGCSSSTEQATTTSTTSGASTPATGGQTTTPVIDDDGRCITRMPGEILSADEAVVRFTPVQVCPGYVTIAPGTPVTFTNADTVVHTITITEGNMPDGAVVATGTAEPGGSWVQTFDTLGSYSYVTDAIPSFRGTVEVTTGDGDHSTP